MPDEAQPPSLVLPTAVAICAGTLACIAAFVTRKFALLFLSAGSLWVLALFCLYRLWWPRVPFVPGRRKVYRGISVLVGLLIFAGTLYIIAWLDPSLRQSP